MVAVEVVWYVVQMLLLTMDPKKYGYFLLYMYNMTSNIDTMAYQDKLQNGCIFSHHNWYKCSPSHLVELLLPFKSRQD